MEFCNLHSPALKKAQFIGFLKGTFGEALDHQTEGTKKIVLDFFDFFMNWTEPNTKNDQKFHENQTNDNHSLSNSQTLHLHIEEDEEDVPNDDPTEPEQEDLPPLLTMCPISSSSTIIQNSQENEGTTKHVKLEEKLDAKVKNENNLVSPSSSSEISVPKKAKTNLYSKEEDNLLMSLRDQKKHSFQDIAATFAKNAGLNPAITARTQKSLQSRHSILMNKQKHGRNSHTAQKEKGKKMADDPEDVANLSPSPKKRKKVADDKEDVANLSPSPKKRKRND